MASKAWVAGEAIAGGAVPLALLNMKPPGIVKLVFEWQLSQAAPPKAM